MSCEGYGITPVDAYRSLLSTLIYKNYTVPASAFYKVPVLFVINPELKREPGNTYFVNDIGVAVRNRPNEETIVAITSPHLQGDDVESKPYRIWTARII